MSWNIVKDGDSDDSVNLPVNTVVAAVADYTHSTVTTTRLNSVAAAAAADVENFPYSGTAVAVDGGPSGYCRLYR